MTGDLLLWLALLAAFASLPPLFVFAWGATGGDGAPANQMAAILGLGVAIAAVASVVAALRALTSSPTTWTVGVMAAPLVLAALAALAAGPRSWRADPRSRLTADDVRAMGLDPAEHGFDEGTQWRSVVLTILFVAAPLAAPALALAAERG